LTSKNAGEISVSIKTGALKNLSKNK